MDLIKRTTFATALCAITLLLHNVPTSEAAACSFFGYRYSLQYETASAYRGVGGHIYSTQQSINDTTNNHVVYSYMLTEVAGQIPTPAQCALYLEVGRLIGQTGGGTPSSPSYFTYNPNDYVFGNGTCGSSGILAAEHVYGAVAANDGYWVYQTGYHNWDQYGNAEYQYYFDFGSLGNHASYVGWSPNTQLYPRANSEVYQSNQNVPCESMNAYWGTDSSGNPSTANAMGLTYDQSQTPSFSQWTDSSTSPGADSGYSWTFLQNYWAAHSSGSPS